MHKAIKDLKVGDEVYLFNTIINDSSNNIPASVINSACDYRIKTYIIKSIHNIGVYTEERVNYYLVINDSKRIKDEYIEFVLESETNEELEIRLNKCVNDKTCFEESGTNLSIYTTKEEIYDIIESRINSLKRYIETLANNLNNNIEKFKTIKL